MEHEKLSNLVEDTINCLDEIQVAKTNPFLYTRIMNRIGEKEKKRTGRFTFDYTFKLVAIFAVLIIINALTLLNLLNSSRSVNTSTNNQDINSFIKEYSLDNATYYY